MWEEGVGERMQKHERTCRGRRSRIINKMLVMEKQRSRNYEGQAGYGNTGIGLEIVDKHWIEQKLVQFKEDDLVINESEIAVFISFHCHNSSLFKLFKYFLKR